MPLKGGFTLLLLLMAALVYQALLTDPFERDDSFQLYIKWGYQVGRVRNELKAMPLDAFEVTNLRQQDAPVARITMLHEEIADLAARDKSAQAQALIASHLRPLNLQFIDMVEDLRQHERDEVNKALLSTQEASKEAVRFHLILGGDCWPWPGSSHGPPAICFPATQAPSASRCPRWRKPGIACSTKPPMTP